MSLLAKSRSIEDNRRTAPFHARKASYGLGEQVQIEVGVQGEYIDFENSRLIFDLHLTTEANGAASDTRPVPWMASALIKNLRVKSMAGSMIGNEIREYRSWYRMMKELTSNSDLNESYLHRLEGAVQENLADSTPFIIQYAHKFEAHIFSIKEYYPLHFHQGIMIEFDLPSEVSELFTATTTLPLKASVTIQEVKYVADLVKLNSAVEQKMVDMMNANTLFADYVEVLTQEDPIKASTGLQSYDIIGIDGRVKTIFQYGFRDALRNGLGASQVNEYFGTAGRNGLSTYRFKLGANYLNYEAIKIGGEARSAEQTFELLKALDCHTTDNMKACGDSALATTTLDIDRFVIGVKIDKAQKNSDETISSRIDKDRNNVRVELNYSSAPASVLTSYIHVVLDKRVQILPGSQVRNIRN